MFFFSITIFFPFPVLFIYFLNILAIGSNNFLFVPFEINFFFGSHGFLFALRGFSFSKGSVVTIFSFFLLNQLFLTGPMEKNSGTSGSFLFLEPQASKPQLGSLIGTLRLLSRVHAVSLLFFHPRFIDLLFFMLLSFSPLGFLSTPAPCSVFTECCLCSLFSSFCFYHHLPFLPSLSFFSSSLCCHYPVPLTCSLIIKNLVSCPLFLFYSLVYIYNMLSIFPSILFSSFSPLPSRSLPSFHYLRSCWSTLASSLLFCSCLGLFCFLFCD